MNPFDSGTNLIRLSARVACAESVAKRLLVIVRKT
ncbi:hypothetical protein BRAS3843_1010013 [Bradyrhizobium sp. STM 3843]|nr:hypothetical protein BRAS3843_1010013 [Bradyrhizobium sp. STM 3843]